MEHSTLKKLSGILGISISTVSRALSDHPDISEMTKKKVKELATMMEYEPNNYAVQLRTRQSHVLGILVPSIDNFFYDSFIAAVEEDARAHGYSVLIMQSKDQVEIENSNLNLFRKSMVSGVFAAVTVETEDMKLYERLLASEIPVVFFDRVADLEGCSKVCIADEMAARIAAEAIIEKKKKRVLALFGHPHLSITQKRSASFENVFASRSPKTKLQLEFPETIAESKRLVLQVLKEKKKPDCIFCMGDLILIGVMYAIHQLNLKIPEDISVISISNGFIPTMYNPKITYVETSGYKLGKLAFLQMLSAVKNEPVKAEVSLESHLVEGGSL
jgi:LacI family transcriptional regulator